MPSATVMSSETATVRQKPSKVELTMASGANRSAYCLDEYDAAFLSRASWDKFVLPFYERVLPGDRFAELQAAVRSQTLAALVHLPTCENACLRSPDWATTPRSYAVDLEMTIPNPNGDRATAYLVREPEAVFWSESAWDKFAMPYYERLMIPNQFADLQAALQQPDAAALVHTATGPSILCFRDGALTLWSPIAR